MATTGIINATLFAIYIGGTKVADATSAEISMSMATRDATSKDSNGWTDRKEGLREWSGSGEAFIALDAAYGLSDIYGLINNRTAVTIKYSTEVSGDTYYTGTAYLTEWSLSNGVEESGTYSFSFEGDGALTEGTIA